MHAEHVKDGDCVKVGHTTRKSVDFQPRLTRSHQHYTRIQTIKVPFQYLHTPQKPAVHTQSVEKRRDFFYEYVHAW